MKGRLSERVDGDVMSIELLLRHLDKDIEHLVDGSVVDVDMFRLDEMCDDERVHTHLSEEK